MSGTGLDVGALIDGRFRVERPLGEGGYGSVVAATDLETGKEVALKLVARPTQSRERKRWAAECEAMRAIAHESLPRYVAAGDHGTTVSYVAMSLEEGPTLASVLRDGVPLPLSTAVTIALELASALAAVHTAGLVHRDVKPANIVLASREGVTHVVLVDFGLAHSTQLEVSWSRPTRTGTVVGTASYLAPERIEGARGDVRADVWSLGIVLFEMLTGRPPFRSKTATRTMLQVLSTATPLLPPALPLRAELTEILGHALSKSAGARFASADAFRDALAALPVERRIALDPATGARSPNEDDATATCDLPVARG
jgi:serine/threonine protein kinase